MGNKSVNNLYKPMLEHSNVEQKFHKAAKGKTERPDVAVILEPTNIQRHVKNVVEQLENTAPEGYDVPHPEKAWKPSRISAEEYEYITGEKYSGGEAK